MDIDAPIDALAEYILEYLPWLGTHPELGALLILFGPLVSVALAQYGLRRRRKASRGNR